MSKENRIEEMFKQGVHFGYSKTRRHPTMSPYIFATKNGIDIIDIEKTENMLEKVSEYVKSLAESGKTILFVGTKPEAKQAILEIALPLGMPYVTERWVGGALTNFPEIKKRINRLLSLREQKEKGELEKYTKKERLMIDREIADMTKNFDGITSVTKTPDVMFVVDPKKEYIAVTEAKKMNMEVIAIMSTDCNLKSVDHAIVANDGSVSSISYFTKTLKKAFESGIKEENN